MNTKIQPFGNANNNPTDINLLIEYLTLGIKTSEIVTIAKDDVLIPQ